MLHTFVALVSDKPVVLTRTAALLLCLALLPTIAIAQSQPPQLKIRIINAKTNKPVQDENLNIALKVDQIGSVAMAKTSAPHTTGSQFFICIADDSTKLQPLYSLFGKVASGLSVALATQQGDVMQSVTVTQQT